MRIAPSLFCAVGISLILVASGSADWPSAKKAYDKQDYVSALKELKPLAASDDARAEALLGQMYEFGRGVPRDFARAFKLSKAAADRGNASGELQVGMMYANGWGVPADPTKGLWNVRLAAHQGLPEACFALGMIYLGRPGIPADIVKADTWFRVAAARGFPGAAQQRGSLEGHMSPDQITQAESLALEWEVSFLPAPHAKSDSAHKH
jgi:TPR repeat protein